MNSCYHRYDQCNCRRNTGRSNGISSCSCSFIWRFKEWSSNVGYGGEWSGEGAAKAAGEGAISGAIAGFLLVQAWA